MKKVLSVLLALFVAGVIGVQMVCAEPKSVQSEAEGTAEADTKQIPLENESSESSLGDVIGSFQKSNARMDVHVKGFEARTIPVYEVDYDLCICVEDLQYYGYEMVWDPERRTTELNISDKERTGTMKYVKSRGDILYSDVRIFVDGMEIKGYNIGGYTLVKVADINFMDNIYLMRRYGEEEQFAIKGRILLPPGDVAPQGGLSGKVIKYEYGYKGKPEKVAETPFTIPGNNNYCAYTITMKPHEFLGYELDDKYGYYNGSLFVENDRPFEYYRIYTSPIDDYRVNYQNFDVNIFKTVQLQGVLTIDDQMPEYPHETRTVYIRAEDVSGRGEILQAITVPIGQNEINYVLPIIAGREYVLKFYATLYYSLPSRYELWAGPPPDLLFSGYYSTQGLMAGKNQADIITAGKEDVENINIGIKLPDPISKGVVLKGDFKTYFNGEETPSLSIDGEPLIFLECFRGRGYEVEYHEDQYLVWEDPLADKVDLDLKFNWLQLDKLTVGNLACNPSTVYISGKTVDSYKLYGNVVILAKDLQESGLFEVTNDTMARTLVIESLE